MHHQRHDELSNKYIWNNKMTNKFAIDDGSNFIKTAFTSKDGVQTLSFASRVINYAIPDNSTETGFSCDSYKIENENYAVVQDGANAVDIMSTDTNSYQVSVINRVLVHHALRKSGAKGKVKVLVTLPVDQYLNSDGSRNDEIIARKIANIKGDIVYLDGSKKIDIEEVFVLPESLPAFHHAKTTLGLTEGRYFIVDVGGTTSDFIDIQNGQIVKSDSLPIGALSMINKFKSVIKGRLGFRDVPDSAALQGILTGHCFHNDFSEEAQTAVNNFRKLLLDKILTDNQHLKYDSVIFSGGGSVLFESGMQNAIKTDNPQFDNCLGGLAIIESLED